MGRCCNKWQRRSEDYHTEEIVRFEDVDIPEEYTRPTEAFGLSLATEYYVGYLHGIYDWTYPHSVSQGTGEGVPPTRGIGAGRAWMSRWGDVVERDIQAWEAGYVAGERARDPGIQAEIDAAREEHAARHE